MSRPFASRDIRNNAASQCGGHIVNSLNPSHAGIRMGHDRLGGGCRCMRLTLGVLQVACGTKTLRMSVWKKFLDQGSFSQFIFFNVI